MWSFKNSFSKDGVSPDSLVGKEYAYNSEDPSWIYGSRRFPGEGKGCALQYSGLENFMNCPFRIAVLFINYLCFAYKMVMVLTLLESVLSLLTNNRRGKFRIKYQKKLHAKLFFSKNDDFMFF